ncbi:hypothetical protein GCM10023322_65940 [Rugosimonospora acidiphila]|uniref:DUF4190 domain-containing protein n=1 Tax=Rugosimonospora acidiphila TaxID=556531 RepID=A0ABP9SL48_9ACTN
MRNLLARRHDDTESAAEDATTRESVINPRAADDQTTTHRIPTRHRATATVTEPASDTTVEVERPRWAHVSAMATLSLIIGVVAVAAALTGLMAAEAIVLGVIGGAIAAGGLVGASRRGVTGHSLALLGLIASLGAILLGVLAIGSDLSWLDSKTDEVGRLHSWLLTQLPWLKHW